MGYLIHRALSTVVVSISLNPMILTPAREDPLSTDVATMIIATVEDVEVLVYGSNEV